MAEPQHFCLRWNNYQSSITSAFENLRDDEDFVDVTLACDGRSIKAHRVVLSACSPYFRELLKSTSCKHPVIVLQDVSFLDLHALVEFIYHGEVNVHQNSLSSFLKTAEILRVSGLTQQQAAETNSQLAHIQNLAAQNSTGSGSSSSHRTSLLNHQAFSDRSSLHDDSLYPRGGSSTSPTPPPSLPPHFSSLPHHQQHLPRRPTVYRRDRNNSSISDDFGAIKRHRSDNNGPLLGNPSPDPNSVSPQVTPADFSTIKHNNNNTPPLKDEKRKLKVKSFLTENFQNSNLGNGPNGNIEKELSPTPSQDRSPTEGDVKSEPMELVCSNNNPNDNNSNDSCNIGDNENNTGRDNPANSGDVKGSLSSGNDDEHENSVQHPAGNFLISPDNKLFPGNFNFMGPLHDHLNFNALQSPNDISSQGGGTNILGGVIVPGGNNNSSNNNFHLNPHQIHHHLLHSPPNQHHHPQTQPPPPPTTHYHLDTSPLHHHHSIHHRRRSLSPSMTSGVSASVTASNMGSGTSPASSSTSNVQRGDRDVVVGPGGSGGSSRLLLPLPLSACHRCDVCGKLLSTKLTLKRHKEQQHLQPLNNAVCNLCHKVFRTLNSLNNHKSIYHRRQKNHHHHSYFHHTNSLHHPLSLTGGSGGSAVPVSSSSSSGSGNTGRMGINELLSPSHHEQSGQGPQNAHVTGTPSSSNSSPSPNSIAASSNSISSSSNNNNNIHNNNNADTSPVYIKHPQSPSPTGQLQQPLRMPPPQQGINEPQECPYCKRSFSCYYSLKRHFQDKHEQSDTLYVCEFCQRRYRTKNSLTTHKSLQHRGSSGMLKRLLKTTAIKNVLGSHHRDPFPMAHPRSHFIDFTSDLGQQPPPGIQ